MFEFEGYNNTASRQSNPSNNLCSICYCSIEKYIVPPLPVFQKVVNSCSKYLHSAITKDPETGTDKWDNLNQEGVLQLPFCQQCFDTSLELSQLHDHLEKFEKDIADLILTFTLKILHCRNRAISQNAFNNGFGQGTKMEIDVSGFNAQLLGIHNKTFTQAKATSQVTQTTYGHFSWGDNQQVESVEVKCDPPYGFNEITPVVDHFLSGGQSNYYDQQMIPHQQQSPSPTTFFTSSAYSPIIEKLLQQNAQFPITPLSANSTMEIGNGSVLLQETPEPYLPSAPAKKRRRQRIKINRATVEKSPLKNLQVKIERLQFGKDGNVILPQEYPELNIIKPGSKAEDRVLIHGQREITPERCSSNPDTTLDMNEYQLSNDENAQQTGSCETEVIRTEKIDSVPVAVVDMNEDPEGNVITTNDNSRKKSSHKGTVYKCRFCFKVFRYPQFLQYHERSHSPEKKKPFQCSHCNKSFVLKTLWKQHMNTHDGTKPYVCNICGYASSWESNLYTHRLTHDKIRYQCKYCNKSYKSWTAIRGHFKRDHANIIITENCVNVSKEP